MGWDLYTLGWLTISLTFKFTIYEWFLVKEWHQLTTASYMVRTFCSLSGWRDDGLPMLCCGKNGWWCDFWWGLLKWGWMGEINVMWGEMVNKNFESKLVLLLLTLSLFCIWNWFVFGLIFNIVILEAKAATPQQTW